MKRILVTGGFGFIGSHLVERLLGDGHYVHIVDNMSSNGVEPWQLLREYTAHVGIKNLAYTPWTVEEFCTPSAPKFDEIYHLASPVGPAGVLFHAGNLVGRIVNDTYLIMALALRDNAKLVDVSTSEVYGGGQQGYCSEELPRIIQADTTIRLEYAVAKLAAETALINTCKVKPLDAVIIRPFNVAGPRQSGKGGFVLPRFIAQAMCGDALTVFGDGKQVRAFTHVADIVDGLLLAMEHGKPGEVYNLGNPANKTTVIALADMVIDVVGKGAPVYVDPQKIYGKLYAEAADKYPNANKAITDLHWNPTRDIRQTVTDAYEYMRLAQPLALSEHLC